jgi:hypothetical protein
LPRGNSSPSAGGWGARSARSLIKTKAADEAQGWLEKAGLECIWVAEYPLEVATGSGPRFLYHPLLRGGFLDDVFECFDDARLANEVMTTISEDVASFTH